MLTSLRGLVAATLIAGSAFAAAPALADETDPPSAITISGSAGVYSQYRWRGLSLSDNQPVFQGTFTISHESGFYVGAWGSSTASDVNKTPLVLGGTEIDVYGGWTKELGGVNVDLGVYGYLYPNAPTGNYYEVEGSVAKTLGPVTAKVGAFYAPAQKVFNYNFNSPTRNNTYIYGELSGDIPGTPLSVHTHLGHTGGGFDYAKPYEDYSAGISYKWKALTLDASIVGTNISKSDVLSGFSSSIGNFCESITPTDPCVISQVDYYHRPAKTVGVISLTASF